MKIKLKTNKIIGLLATILLLNVILPAPVQAHTPGIVLYGSGTAISKLVKRNLDF